MNFNEFETIIYKSQYGCSLRFGTKNMFSHEYDNIFIPVRFKRNTNIENRSKIKVKEAWLSFYITKDSKTRFYIFVNDFELIEVLPEKEQVNPDESILESIDNNSINEYLK